MAADTIPTLRLFISSPGDVGPERRIAEKVIKGLDAEFGDFVRLDPYFWEYEPVVITKDYQEQIPRTSNFDILICILWKKLGSRLHSRYTLPPDFTRVARSGTEYEFADAKHRWDKERVPEILVWWNGSPVLSSSPDAATVAETRREWETLKEFLDDWTKEGEKEFLGQVHTYFELGEFEEQLESRLRNSIKRRLGQRLAEARSRAKWKGNPYRGLDVFDYEDAPIFFGRTGIVGDAITKLRLRMAETGPKPSNPEPANQTAGQPAFLLIFGASGSGKSSLARAGILPMIVNGNVVEGVGLWRCAIMMPSGDSSDLMRALANALVQGKRTPRIRSLAAETDLAPMAIPELTAGGLTVDEIAERLKKDPRCIVGLVKEGLSEAEAAAELNKEEERILRDRIAECDGREPTADNASEREALEKRLAELRPPRACLALLIDQLEEMFTGNHDGIKGFLSAVEALAAGGSAVVLATLRSDFYRNCAAHPALLRLKDGLGSIQLGAAKPEELAQMIRKPAQAAGVVFEETEDGLLNESILRDAEDNPDSLPLLEFCLEQLYELCNEKGRIDYDAYKNIGRLQGVLTHHADKVLEGLKELHKETDPQEWEESLRHILDALATVSEADDGHAGGVKLVRRAARYHELVDNPVTKSLVDAFVGASARLFKTDIDADDEIIVSVTHEALLRNWEFAKEWLSGEETLPRLRIRARVEQRLAQWRESAAKEGTSEGDASYLLQRGRELDDAEEQYRKHPKMFSAEAQSFIVRSMEAEAEENFRACIQAGGEEKMLECSRQIEKRFPKARIKVLTHVTRAGNISARRNAALLLGRIEPTAELATELIRLAVSDPDEAVRHAAALGMARLDRGDLFRRIAEMADRSGEELAAVGALARILGAADMEIPAPGFDAWFQACPEKRQGRIRQESRWLRLRAAVPVFFAVVIPATILASLSAMAFKWLPGYFNYSFAQDVPGAFIAVFHAAVAALLVGDGSAAGLIFYRMVLGREHGKFDYFRPMGAVIAGALAGALGGFLCTCAITGVYQPPSLYEMGWIDHNTYPGFFPFVYQLFFRGRCGLVYLFNGMGVGIGMALITNRLRGSKKWEEFLNTHTTSSLSDLKQARRLMSGLISLTFAHAWPLPLVLCFTSLAGFLFLPHTATSLNPMSNHYVLLGGMPQYARAASGVAHGPTDDTNDAVVKYIRSWKMSAYGRAVGIAADSTTKCIGAFFCTVGIGFGIVILRSGINIEPRRGAS